MKRDQLSERMAQLARGLRSEKTSVDTLEHVVRAAVDLIKPCEAAGISVRHDGSSPHASDELHTVAATDDRPKRSDEIQLELDEGPCVRTTWDDDLVVVPDLVSDTRWPRWAARVVEELGLRSMLCLRLFTDEDRYGVLNLFGPRADALATEEVQVEALAIAAHAAVALAAIEQVEDVRIGSMPRTIIGQATGILMERHSLTDMGAFDLLVRLASESRRKVLDVAREIVAERNAL